MARYLTNCASSFIQKLLLEIRVPKTKDWLCVQSLTIKPDISLIYTLRCAIIAHCVNMDEIDDARLQ